MHSSHEAHHIGALDIGGTKIAASVASEAGILARVIESTVKSGPERALGDQAVALLEAACVKANIDPRRLQQVGVSSCGPFVRVGDMHAVATPNICGGLKQPSDLPNDWIAIPLEQVLRERFDRVVIENDCVAALVAERTFGAAQDEDNCAYVTWSTGVGFGLYVDGNVLRGKHGNAGHAGHMLMSETSTAVCGCGNVGDLEALVSGRNIGLAQGRSAPELFSAARQGDEAALQLALAAARWFGRGLYNLTAALDMRVFVIGGSVWTHHGEWLMPTIMQEIESRFPALTEGVLLRPAMLQELVADVGACSLVMPREWIAPWRLRRPWEKIENTGQS